MAFHLAHTNLNVIDLEKSLDFYQKALGLREHSRKEAEDFTIVYLTDDEGQYLLELTWLADRTEPYDLSDNEIHVAFAADDYAAAHEMHEKMGCICFENPAMGIYFIEDPDGYWLEVIPKK
ncbi:MAG: VOC family protein [Oscillospiraceae bacterium]|jgi:lactoylglutathione lyase